MAGAIKKSTGMFGLKVSQHPEHQLQVLYNKILRVLKNLPASASYRKYTEELVQSRLQVVKDSKNWEEIEQKINCGQVEELIQQAEAELQLARKMKEFTPWDPLVAKPPPNQWTWPPTSH